MEDFMKKIILSIFVSLIGFCAFAFDAAPFLSPQGNVKSYVKTDYSISSKFGEYFRSPKAKFKHIYNDSGLEISSTQYSPSDVIIDKIVYEYDIENRLTSQTCYDSENILLWKSVITYNEAGLKIDSSEFGKGGTLRGKTLYKYDGKNIVDESYYNGTGALLWKNTYKYDDKNILSEASSYFEDGTLDSRETYKYSDKNKLTEILIEDNTGLTKSREVYRYNEDGSVSEFAVYDSSNRAIRREFYKYDAKGNPVKITTYFITQKFGTTVNELSNMSDFTYQY